MDRPLAPAGDTLAPRPSGSLGWLAWAGFGLLLGLLMVALLLGRQHGLVQQALADRSDQAVVAALRAELDLQQLRQAWQDALHQAGRQPDGLSPPEPTARLRDRHAAFAQRTEELERPNLRQLLGDEPVLSEARLAAQRLLLRTRTRLEAQDAAPPSATFLNDLRPALDAAADRLQALSLEAERAAGAQAAARHQAVAMQNRWALLLTAFMSLLTLGFAAIALRQVRLLRARRLALEQLAASLGEARREAEAAGRAKSAFLANISHEIRTPFHGLMGMLSLLRETGLNARQVDYLRTATESADHLLVILNDILDMSQLENGRLTLNPTPVDLRRVLREVEALMRPPAAAKSLALHVEVAPEVPERVMADATRLKQILFNLLSNGIKFCDHGTVTVSLGVRPDSDGDRTLEFDITDTGIGMSEATLARLFNRFAQGDASPSRRHGGTGLGLEISRNLARLMHGDILVSSRPGEGSTFRLRLPLQPVVAASKDGLTPGGDPAGGPRALRVLVAEDHPVNRQYLAALLDNLGHQAHFCANGQEAVQAARSQAYDLVLMDLHMPQLDGLAATRAIRALPDAARSTVPIVALTADGLADTRDRCLVAGMNDFLTKPVSPAKLATLLRQLFGSAPAASRPQPAGGLADASPAPDTGGPALLDASSVAASLEAMPRAQLGTLIAAFLDQGPQTVQHLRSAVRDAQPLALRVNAHAAKGAALNLGLAALAHTAEALHEGAAHLPAHEIARLVQRYEELLPLTREAARAAGLLPADGPPPAHYAPTRPPRQR